MKKKRGFPWFRIILLTILIFLLYSVWVLFTGLPQPQGPVAGTDQPRQSRSAGNSGGQVKDGGQSLTASIREKGGSLLQGLGGGRNDSGSGNEADNGVSGKKGKDNAFTASVSSGLDNSARKKEELKEDVKETATPWLEKIATIMHIDQIIAEKRRQPGWVPLKDIPAHTRQALLAIEDHDFYHHGAIDITGIFRAGLANLQAGEVVQGGSTLTQQMVKNTFLNREQTYSRKLQEAVISFLMERKYTKDDILEIYFNTTYLGNGCYGIRDASEGYFGKPPSRLNLGESLLLASLPYAPTALNPYENPFGCSRRMLLVLQKMQEYGYVGNVEAEQTRKAGVRLKNGAYISLENPVENKQ